MQNRVNFLKKLNWLKFIKILSKIDLVIDELVYSQIRLTNDKLDLFNWPIYEINLFV